MFAKIAFFCAALVAASAYAPSSAQVSVLPHSTQDAYGNYAYRYDIKDAATGSINSKAEVGKVGAVAVAAPAVAYGAYAAPAAAYALAARVAYGGIAAPVLAGRVAYGGYTAPVAYGGVLGHGAALGLGYGAGIYGAGLGKAIY
ncbi:hypothetical protein CEXT_74291 [Caerostris extrusa]|uniref:Uncharacterized protein n=1 Tax=Caerostris extrusa TaxID=172846 RepID=A0AAV4SHJ4_CAEEX|nr:hypothetical protein CEXT_74291 [Caerostris extrusa]